MNKKENLLFFLTIIISITSLLLTYLKPQSPLTILSCILVTIIFILPLILIKKVSSISYKNTLKKQTFKDENYLDKLLKNYSAATLNTIYNGCNLNQNIIVTLINLKHKNKISFLNKITILNSQTEFPTENYILTHIKNGKIEYGEEFNKIVEKEFKDNNLTNMPQKSNIKPHIILLLLSILLLFINNKIIKISLVIIVVFLIIFLFNSYLRKLLNNLLTNQTKTIKEVEIKNKLQGYKNYTNNKIKNEVYSFILSESKTSPYNEYLQRKN